MLTTRTLGNKDYLWRSEIEVFFLFLIWFICNFMLAVGIATKAKRQLKSYILLLNLLQLIFEVFVTRNEVPMICVHIYKIVNIIIG